MSLKEDLQKYKRPKTALAIWLVFLLLVSSLASGTIQTISLVLLLVSLLSAGCYLVFRMMRAMN